MLSGFTDSTFIFCNILIFYSGVDQESILLLFPDALRKSEEILFLKKPTNTLLFGRVKKHQAFDVVELKQ
jgi:hypothetical protein